MIYIFYVPYQRIYAEGMNLEHIGNKLPTFKSIFPNYQNIKKEKEKRYAHILRPYHPQSNLIKNII